MATLTTTLTPEQKALLPAYRKKWLDIGLSTDRFTQEQAETIIHRYQREILGRKETPVEVYDDPIAAWKAVERAAGVDKMEFVYPYQDGSFFASGFSCYDFFVNEKLVTLPDELLSKFEAARDTSKLGLIWPLDKVCIVCQKPTKISRNEKLQLHNETGKAVEYTDTWGFYALNGVVVPEYLVITPAEELSMDFFKKEENADIKAEFVRKYGVERMLDLGKKVDSFENYDQEEHSWWWKSEYELWDMAVLFPGLDYQPFLKMRNQTTKIWHVEALSPNCRTLKDGLKERFGGKEMRIVSVA